MGHSVGLHPVWLIFALFAFGYLFGFVGLLLAVPLAAATGVLIRFALRRYLRQPVLYRRARPADARMRHVTAMFIPPRQLALALDHAESYAREDFLSGPCNATALALIDRWPDWPARAIALDRAGGLRQDAIWRRSGPRRPARASFRRARRSAKSICLPRSRPARWWSKMPRRLIDERALFHLLNLAREEHAFLLFTARTVPTLWPASHARSDVAAAGAAGRGA